MSSSNASVVDNSTVDLLPQTGEIHFFERWIVNEQFLVNHKLEAMIIK